MTTPATPYTEADVKLVGEAIYSADPPIRDGYVHGEDLRDAEARAALDALTAAGRLASARPTPHLDAVKAERDKLVETVGRMISLPPHLVAEAYGVTYTGQVQS